MSTKNTALIATAAVIIVGMIVAGMVIVNDSNNKANSNNADSNNADFTVTYDLNYDGAPDCTNVVYKNGTDIIQPANINTARTDYVFDGWYLDGEYTEPVSFPYKVTKNVTVYAKYIKDDSALPNEEDRVKDTITIASSPDFVPYDYMVGQDWTGIDIDICMAICKEINCNYEFRQVQFGSIISGVASGTYSVGASGITITDERREYVLFSDAYATITNVVVVPVGSDITTYEQAKASKSGAQSGTTGHLLAQEAGFNITAYNTYSDVFQNLKQGKIDCIVLDSDTAKIFILNEENKGRYKIVDGVTIGDEEQYAFVFNNNDQALCDKFNGGLRILKDKGTLDKIIDYYAENGFSSETQSYWKTHTL